MDERIEKALRALAGTAKGPFRPIAYGLGSHEPGRLLRELGFLPDDGEPEERRVIVEEGFPYAAAVDRPRFKAEVLGRLQAQDRHDPKRREIPASIEGRGAPARAREKLAELSSRLPELLKTVDRTLSGIPQEEDAAGELAVPPPPAPEASLSHNPPSAEDLDLIPILLVRKFEDLGSDAEAAAQTMDRIIVTGTHLVVHEDGLDTRTREGRALTRYTLRLGTLKATRSRERAVADLARRRDGLQVYGPIPFGFVKDGRELRPVPDQLETVRRIRELTGLSQTPVTIAVTLNREKRLWKDGTRWTWRRVSHVLKNPIYDKVLSEAVG